MHDKEYSLLCTFSNGKSLFKTWNFFGVKNMYIMKQTASFSLAITLIMVYLKQEQ